MILFKFFSLVIFNKKGDKTRIKIYYVKKFIQSIFI